MSFIFAGFRQSDDQSAAIRHYLPNLYTVVRDYTPETVFLDTDADLVTELRRPGWGPLFVKDHVKSLKTSVGSII